RWTWPALPASGPHASGPRANASKFRCIRCSHQGGREKIGVQGGCLAFAGHAHFRRMLLEQAQRQLAHEGEVLGRMTLLNATGVFIETNIQLPMQTILNPPMITQRLSKLPRRHPSA